MAPISKVLRQEKRILPSFFMSSLPENDSPIVTQLTLCISSTRTRGFPVSSPLSGSYMEVGAVHVYQEKQDHKLHIVVVIKCLLIIIQIVFDYKLLC